MMESASNPPPGSEIPETSVQPPNAPPRREGSPRRNAADADNTAQTLTRDDAGKGRATPEPQHRETPIPVGGPDAPAEVQNYPPRPPHHRRDSAQQAPVETSGTDPAALEAGGDNRPKHFLAWIHERRPLPHNLLNDIIESPELMNTVIEMAKQRAKEQAEAMRPSYPDDNLLTSTLRYSAAAIDAKHSQRFRETLRVLELGDENDAPLTLDFVRDVFTSLKTQVDELGPKVGLELTPDLVFMKKKAAGDIDALIASIGLTAYDKTGTQRGLAVAAVAATLLIGVVPFSYAYYTEPTSFYYLGGLASAYSRTLMLATGLAANPSTTLGMVLDHAKERELIWAMPSLF
jgi:hypothetical protein